MRLWIQLAIVIVVAAVGPLLVTGYQALQITENQSVKLAEQAVEQTAETVAAEVKRWVASRREFLTGWMTLFPELADQPPEQREGFLRAVYKSLPAVTTVALRAPNGELYQGPEGKTTLPVFQAKPSEAQRKLGRIAGSPLHVSASTKHLPKPALGVSTMGKPFFVESRDNWSVVVSAMGGADRELVMAAELSLTEVSDILQLHEGDRTIALLGPQGDVLLGEGDALVNADLLKELLGQSASFEYQPSEGLYVRGAVAGVPHTDWTAVVVEPAAVALEVSRPLRTQLLLALSLSLFVALAAGILLSRPLSRPILTLRDAANRVSEGEFGREVPIERSDELGELATAFNRMSLQLETNRGELEAQQQEIEAFNAELQQRVEERTQELRDAQKTLIRTGQLAAVAEVGAGLAHELNNPLAGILGLAQVLRMKHQGTPDAMLLENMEKEAMRCREVVEAMLRISSGDVDPADAPVIALEALIGEVFGLVSGSFRQRGVELVMDEIQTGLRVKIGPVQGSRVLTQVLTSLCAGLSAGAALSVSAFATTDRVVHVVFRPNQPLAQGEARDDWMASGMSLWVARQMLDRYGGVLVEPEPGQLHWTVTLPEFTT